MSGKRSLQTEKDGEVQQNARAREKDAHTLANSHTLHGLVIHGAGTLLEEFVPLDANVEHLRALNAESHKFFHDHIDDVRGRLIPRNKIVRTFCYSITDDPHLVFGEVGLRGRLLSWFRCLGHDRVQQGTKGTLEGVDAIAMEGDKN